MTELDPGQADGVGDMGPDAFREHGRRTVDWIADYLEGVGDLPVLSPVDPGDIRGRLPDRAPAAPDPMDAILTDLDEVILPGITHWNHPAFHAYFAISSTGPAILAEAVAAALNVNGMLWKTSPAATELEQVVLEWLARLLELPSDFRGVIMDTASVATLVALAAARERSGLDIRARGMAGRDDLPPLRVYTSEQAHSSVEKAAITLGLGRDGVRTVATDDRYRMDPAALRAAMSADLDAGVRPLAVVATVGTTSTTSVDPVDEIAEVRDDISAAAPGVEEPVWLHVDAAYGGLGGVLDETRWVLDGIEHADSMVTNPHKWLFTPIDCSAFYVRDVTTLKRTFSLVPEYLTTSEQGAVEDYMDWGIQLGRRFRALKLWMVLRYFGADGVRRRIRAQLDLTRSVADWVDDSDRLERLAPTPLTTVCFRAHPSGVDDEDALTALNLELLEAVNDTGRAYLSHTVLDGRYTLRLAVGNLRTTPERLERTLEIVDTCLDQCLRDR